MYAFILCLHYTLIGVFTTAPQLKPPGAPNLSTYRDICRRTWWKNLLYIGTYSFDKFGLDQEKYPAMGVSSLEINIRHDMCYIVTLNS